MDWRKRVEQKMAEKGITHRTDLCHFAGISAGSLNMAMRGNHDLKPATMKKVADVLGTTVQWLMYGDDRQIPERVPLCKSPADVFQFTEVMTARDKNLINSGESSDVEFVQIADGMKANDQQFAWRINQHDMAPLFSIGTCLIIEQREPYVDWNGQDTYAMGSWIKDEGNRSSGFRDVFVRKLCRAADQIYWEAMNPNLPPIPWYDYKDTLHYVGLVVQWIHTPKY